MKKLLYGILAVFLTAVLLVLIVPNFIDWSNYKHPIMTTVKNHTGFELDLKGPLHFQIFPTPHLSAMDVSIKNKPEGRAENLIELKSFSLNADLIPLLFGEIIIRQIEFIQPTIFLEIFQNGQNNWDMGNVSPPSSSTQPFIDPRQTSARENNKFNFSLKKIKIKNGSVTINNFQKNSLQEVKGINIEGSLDSLTGPFLIIGEFEIDHYNINGKINTGEFNDQKHSLLTASLSVSKGDEKYGTVDIEGNLLDKQFSGVVKSDTLKIPLSFDIGHKKLDFQKGLQVSGHVDASSESINISNLDLQLGTLKVVGTASYKMPQIKCNLTFSEGASKVDFSANGQSNKDKAHLWEGSVSINSDAPHVFLEWFSLDKVPYLQGFFNVSTDLSIVSNTYALTALKFKVGSLEGFGKATITIDPQKSRPYIAADLTFNALDVNAYLPDSKSPSVKIQKSENLAQNKAPEAISSKIQPSSISSERWSKESFDLKFLKIVDMDFTFNIDRLDYDNYHLQKARGMLHLKEGNLHLNSFQALLYGGKIKGDVSIHPRSSPMIKLNGAIQGMNLASFPDIKKTPLKKAILNSSMHFSATGMSIWEIINTLSGEIKLDLMNGIIEAFDIKKFVNGLKLIKIPSDIGDLISGTHKKSATPFTYLKADFILNGGKATSRNIEFLSEDVRMDANGEINLLQWTINMNANINITALTTVPPFGMAIEGSLDSPSFNIDADSLAKVLLGGAVNVLLDTATGIGGTVGSVINGVLSDVTPQTAQPNSHTKKTKDSVNPEKFIKNFLGL